MKSRFLRYPAALAAAVLLFSSSVPAQESAAENASASDVSASAEVETAVSVSGFGTESAPLVNGAVTAADGVSFRLESTLDYPAGTYVQNYIFENTSDSDAQVTVDFPLQTTLAEYGASGREERFTFSSDGTISSHHFLMPLLSNYNIKADEVTAEQLRSLDGVKNEETERTGTLYTLDTEGLNGDTVTLTPDSGSTLEVYPMGASYSAGTLDDGTVTYTVTADAGYDTAYLFIPEGTDYSVTSDADEKYYPSEQSSMHDFLELCCQVFLEHSDYPGLTADDLAPYLITALTKSTIASDPSDTLEWIVGQTIFSVSSVSADVPAGSTVTVSASESGTIDGITVYINPNALEHGAFPAADKLTVVLPEGYSRASLHGALGNFNESTSSFHVSRTSNGVYSVTAGNAPFWQKAFTPRVIIPMIIIMVVFLLFCFASYRAQKKNREANAEKEAAQAEAEKKKAEEAEARMKEKPEKKKLSELEQAKQEAARRKAVGMESAKEKYAGKTPAAPDEKQAVESHTGAEPEAQTKSSQNQPPKRRSLAERANIGSLGGDDTITPQYKDGGDQE